MPSTLPFNRLRVQDLRQSTKNSRSGTVAIGPTLANLPAGGPERCHNLPPSSPTAPLGRHNFPKVVASDPSGDHNFREVVPILASGGTDPKIRGANFLKSGCAGDVRSA